MQRPRILPTGSRPNYSLRNRGAATSGGSTGTQVFNYSSQNRSPEAERQSALNFYRSRSRLGQQNGDSGQALVDTPMESRSLRSLPTGNSTEPTTTRAASTRNATRAGSTRNNAPVVSTRSTTRASSRRNATSIPPTSTTTRTGANRNVVRRSASARDANRTASTRNANRAASTTNANRRGAARNDNLRPENRNGNGLFVAARNGRRRAPTTTRRPRAPTTTRRRRAPTTTRRRRAPTSNARTPRYVAPENYVPFMVPAPPGATFEDPFATSDEDDYSDEYDDEFDDEIDEIEPNAMDESNLNNDIVNAPPVVHTILQQFRTNHPELVADSVSILSNFFNLGEYSRGLTKEQIESATITYRFKLKKDGAEDTNEKKAPKRRKKGRKGKRNVRNTAAEAVAASAADSGSAASTSTLTAAASVPSTSAGDSAVSSLSEDNTDTCVICYERFANNCKLRRLACMHSFHFKCIDNWLKNNVKCPICRTAVQVDYDQMLQSLERNDSMDQFLRDQERLVNRRTISNALRVVFR